MSAAAFDTLAATRRLEEAGMERGLAEAVATVVRDRQDDLATKGDIGELDTRLTASIGELDTRLTASIGELDTRLTASIGELDTRLTGRIDKLDDRLGTLQWVIGIVAATSMATLAVLLAHSL